jgi:cobalt-zinc-cadmium efflux system protein
VIIIAVISTIAVHAQIANALSHVRSHISADFIVFWTAARAPQPYDAEALTAAQYWYMQTDTLRPFAYPPSFLPWIKPFSLLPMSLSYLLWTASTAALFLLSWRGLVERRSLAMATVAPTFILAAIPGQAVFLLGALVVAGIRLVEKRPILAGVLLGLAANTAGLAVLAGGGRAGLNLRSAYLEVLADLLGSAAVVGAAVVIAVTGAVRVDAVVGIGVALAIVPRTWRLLREAVDVLLEAAPRAVDLRHVREHVLSVPGVVDVHDLHAWTITSGLPVLSAHVVVRDEAVGDGHGGPLLDQLGACLSGHFDVEHCTFQLEPAGHREHEHGAC